MTFKELRKRRNLTQWDVAKRLDVDQGAVSNWERGISMPCRKYRIKLGRMFGISLEELMEVLERGQNSGKGTRTIP